MKTSKVDGIHKYRTVLAVIVFMMCFVVAVCNEPSLAYDSGAYNRMSTMFINENGFSFANFENINRGFVFPFIIFVFRFLGGAHGYEVFTSIMMSALIVFFLPKLLSVKLSGMEGIFRTVVFVILILLFWPWVLFDRLSDIWALFFAITSTLSARVALEKKNEHSVFYVFQSGFFAYAAYNTRTIYLFLAIALFLVLAMGFISLKKSLNAVIYLAVFLTGFAICGVPQAISNNAHHGTRSIMVDNDSLFMKQINWGLTHERYDTSLHPDTRPDFRYIYEGGYLILATLPPPEEESSLDIKDFMYLCIKHPLDMMVLYFRHFINILTVAHPKTYLTNPASSLKQIYISGSILLWIVALLAFIQQRADKIKINSKDALWDGVLLIPTLMIIPGAIEIRFGIMAFMLLYCYLCYCTDYKALWSFVKKYRLPVIAGSVVLYVFWLTVIASTMISANLLLS